MIQVKLTGEFIKLVPVSTTEPQSGEGSPLAENNAASAKSGVFDMEYESGMTISQLVARLGVKERGIKYTIMVNNSRKPEDYELCDSDSVLIIPLLAGG
ncbi:MAG: MoaD/ThiS family protein [Treponema sp.]|jgi:molybdopterin converting factor small subunit|nr:MoaD/ThiS family protein [Treponema sp.]